MLGAGGSYGPELGGERWGERYGRGGRVGGGIEGLGGVGRRESYCHHYCQCNNNTNIDNPY